MTTQPKKGRVIAGRVTSGLMGLAILAMTQVYLSAFLVDVTGPHSTHEYSNVIYGLLLGIPILMVAARPSMAVGALRFGFVAAAAGLIGVVAARDFATDLIVWSVLLMVVAPLVDLIGGFGMWRGSWVTVGRLVWPPLLLAAGFSVYMADQIGLQANGSLADPHVELRHYSYMAITLLAIALGGFVATADVPGRRAAGVMAGGSAALLGLGSMLTGGVSAYGTIGELALIVGGVAFIVLVAREPEEAKVLVKAS